MKYIMKMRFVGIVLRLSTHIYILRYNLGGGGGQAAWHLLCRNWSKMMMMLTCGGVTHDQGDIRLNWLDVDWNYPGVWGSCTIIVGRFARQWSTWNCAFQKSPTHILGLNRTTEEECHRRVGCFAKEAGRCASPL